MSRHLPYDWSVSQSVTSDGIKCSCSHIITSGQKHISIGMGPPTNKVRCIEISDIKYMADFRNRGAYPAQDHTDN